MPSSYPENIPHIVHLVAKYKPKTVMDIGVGRGKYAFLLREYFHKDVQGDWKPIDKIDGLEIFPEYVTEIHKLLYDNIFIGNALEFDFGDYDMFLIIDVLEHWPKEEAYRIMDKLTAKGKVVISTPTNIGCQGAAHGNVWETHVTQWLPRDFEGRYRILEDWSNESSFIYLIDKL